MELCREMNVRHLINLLREHVMAAGRASTNHLLWSDFHCLSGGPTEEAIDRLWQLFPTDSLRETRMEVAMAGLFPEGIFQGATGQLLVQPSRLLAALQYRSWIGPALRTRTGGDGLLGTVPAVDAAQLALQKDVLRARAQIRLAVTHEDQRRVLFKFVQKHGCGRAHAVVPTTAAIKESYRALRVVHWRTENPASLLCLPSSQLMVRHRGLLEEEVDDIFNETRGAFVRLAKGRLSHTANQEVSPDQV